MINDEQNLIKWINGVSTSLGCVDAKPNEKLGFSDERLLLLIKDPESIKAVLLSEQSVQQLIILLTRWWETGTVQESDEDLVLSEPFIERKTVPEVDLEDWIFPTL